MALLFVIAVCLMMVSAVNIAMLPVEDSWHQNRSFQLESRIARLGQAIQDRYREAPSEGLHSPEEIIQIDGYQHLRLELPDFFKTTIGTSINGGVWRFDRRVIWIESPYDSVGDDAYVKPENNRCGTGGAVDAVSWCGRSASLWAKIESRDGNDLLLLSEKQRLFRTMSKFVRAYTRDGKFSNLSAGVAMTLPAIVGYSGTPKDCTGIFSYGAVLLTCDNLFNQWGNPTVVNQVTVKHIALVSRTGVVDGGGTPVRLAEETILE